MRNFVVLFLIGCGLLTLALVVRSGIFARKNPGRPINSVMRQSMEAQGIPELSSEDAMTIAQKYRNASRLPSGLMFVRRAAGTGEPARDGQEVVVHYDGRLLDGTPFDSSYERGTPYTFRLGSGLVIKGWDEIFRNMRKGEKRTLIVPHWLAYGLDGRPPKIPPRATLVFEVELLDIR